MEKRFIAFVVASVLIMAGFMLLQIYVFPKPPQKNPIPLAKKEEKKEGDKKPEKKPDPKKVEGGEKKPPEEPEKKPPVVEFPEPAPQLFSLGSIDPTSPYRMLVTLNNQGGAIERVELSSRHYLDLEDRSGYLGHLALTSAGKTGCVVNVVGHGTPAALATASGAKPGLLPGDVILSLDGEVVSDPADVEELLHSTKPGTSTLLYKPGQTVLLKVRRTVAGKSVDLDFSTELNHRPLAMMRPEFGTATDPNEPQPLSMLLTLHSVGPANAEGTSEGATKIKRGERELEGLPSLRNRRWEAKPLTAPSGETEGVEFRFPLDEAALKEIGQSGRLEVVKRYRLKPTPIDNQTDNNYKSYHLEFEIEIANRGDKPQQVAYQLSGPNGLPLEGWWYQNKIHPGWASAGARDVIWNTKALGHNLVGCPVIYDNAIAKTPKPNPLIASSMPEDRRTLKYAGVDAQYFTAALLPFDSTEETETSYVFEQGEAIPNAPKVKKDKSGRKTTNVTFVLTSPATRIEAGQSLKQSYLIFAGPKEKKLLSEYGLDKAIEYGWFPWVAKPLSWILAQFYKLTSNYGIAIIMLTILVRACLFPIGRKMAKNMQAMQNLQPEIKAVKEKYKDDLAKQGKAQQELFRKHKINPYAGCLPLFLQMPIFIGLYRALSVDISLRQAELIPGIAWASNLAGPDMLWRWHLWDMLSGEAGYLGPYLNVFPLVTAGLFLVQQYLFTPPPTDEQQEMTQKMMYFMTIFMSVMFFKVPAGLCVYFITSSLWGIAERTLMMPKKKTAGAATAAKKKLTEKPGTNGESSGGESRRKQKKED